MSSVVSDSGSIPTVEDFLASVLPLVDDQLAEEEARLETRPLYAAVRVARECVMEVGGENDAFEPNLETLDFLEEDWFRGFYQLTEEWYSRKYGASLLSSSRNEELAFVNIQGTPFEVRVPTSIISPDEPGKTAFLQMPDQILPAEEPLTWISRPPNLAELSRKIRRQVVEDLSKTCNLLRAIASKRMGVRESSAIVRGFLSAARGHLSTAPRLVIDRWQGGGKAKAAWELQMACECSLKAVAQSKLGRFSEHHDLFILFDEVNSHLQGFDRNRLKRLPRWKEMVSMRYGQGRSPTLSEVFEWYLITLQVVNSSLAVLSEIGLGKVRFKIGLPPWKQPFVKPSDSEGSA